MNIQELKKEAANLQPVLRIGKRGMTESVFVEVQKLLKRRSLVKVKILPNSPVQNTKDIAMFIADKTSSALVSAVGNTFVVYKKNAKAAKKDKPV